jgi:putative acetyltransferase
MLLQNKNAVIHGDGGAIIIIGYEQQYAEAFERLNRAWLEEYDLLEEGDLPHLQRPQETILDQRGEIFFAIRGGESVGTCAVILREAGRVELVKLAVTSEVRGQGLGRRLVEKAIEWARQHAATTVVLLSSTRLKDALRLYERLGFKTRPLPTDVGYATADVYMELRL